MHTESYTGEQVTHGVPHQQELNRQEPLGKVLYKGSIILEGFFFGGGRGAGKTPNCASSFGSPLLTQAKSFSGNMIVTSLFRHTKCL